MNNVLVLDSETTVTNKGHPFTMDNKLVVVGVLDLDRNVKTLYWDDYTGLQDRIDSASLLVGFNIKFDLHWLRRVGICIDLLRHRIWDCQLAEFILTGQRNPYPSLDAVASKYDLGSKLDVV